MNKQFSDERLLKMAMGVPETEDADEMKIMKFNSEWMIVPERDKDKLTKRKRIRHNIFKIIKSMKYELELTPEQIAIKSIFDPQLNTNHQINWATFTFYWDIHPKDQTQLITKDRWFMEGGGYDELGSLAPPAFTKQEI